MRLPIASVIGLAAALAVSDATVSSAAAGRDPGRDSRGHEFVRRVGRELQAGDRRFRVVGASNYYLMYKSPRMVDNVLEAAAASGFNVVRIWGSLDIGNQDGSNSIRGKADGVYFHYWSGGTSPAFNDGADGLQRLDYVIDKAGQLGLRVIIPFVNNWNDFGGMDQYVRWRGGQFHDEFYTDPLIRGWYRGWISHLLNRVNSYNGIAYKDDATILSWELANEPRCRAYGVYPESGTCTTQTLIDWAGEMSTFVKAIDRRHLLSVGDEGFFCIPGATDWTENCGEGVDTLALADLRHIDVASYHLYPDGWGKDAAWGTAWIERHIRESRSIRERALLGEFGWRDAATRNPVYKEWTDTVLRTRGAGAMYWILSDDQDDGTPYPDYDGFTVYCPSPVCTMFSRFGQRLLEPGAHSFAPVADHDKAVTEFDTAVTLPAIANDVTYNRSSLIPESVDLDPGTQGQQTEYATDAGTFAVQDGGSVLFTPATGFAGKAAASYLVKDTLGRRSNAADLVVQVKPDPNAAIKLFSFEAGTDGWGPENGQPTSGSVAQSSDFQSDGSQSLRVTTGDGGWFGVRLAPTPANLTPKTHLKFEIQTTSAGTSQNAALQLTDSWTWCEGSWGWINPGTTTTVEIDLRTLNCGVTDVSRLQAVWVWFSGGGVFYIDGVRAE